MPVESAVIWTKWNVIHEVLLNIYNKLFRHPLKAFINCLLVKDFLTGRVKVKSKHLKISLNKYLKPSILKRFFY